MKITLKDLTVKEKINLDDYITFREEIKKEMPFPEWLGDFSKEDLEKLIKNDSKIWIYYDNEQPVCSMMFIPADEKAINKFGLDLDYNEVADYGPAFVHPNYRGNHLQLQMTEELNRYSKENGYKYAASTVHPENIYSINTLIKDGFELKGFHEFKRGPRNIYIKKL